MINASTHVKNITTAQMSWLISNHKVWFIESEGMYFSSNYCYVEIPCDMENPQGGWEVHE